MNPLLEFAHCKFHIVIDVLTWIRRASGIVCNGKLVISSREKSTAIPSVAVDPLCVLHTTEHKSKNSLSNFHFALAPPLRWCGGCLKHHDVGGKRKTGNTSNFAIKHEWASRSSNSSEPETRVTTTEECKNYMLIWRKMRCIYGIRWIFSQFLLDTLSNKRYISMLWEIMEQIILE